MSRASSADRGLERLRRLTTAGRREGGRAAFLDGLLLGAMVGAAIAGSTVWSRWRAHARVSQPRPAPDGRAPDNEPAGR